MRRRDRWYSFLMIVALSLMVMSCNLACTSMKAPAGYKLANKSRLDAVEPMLQIYSTDHPADKQQVADLVRSWHVEVSAQQANP